MNNLGSLKGPSVRTAIGAVGACLLYLSPYSPDLNPIEPCRNSTCPRSAVSRRNPDGLPFASNPPSKEAFSESKVAHGRQRFLHTLWTKSATDDYRGLDVRRWAREGMLRPGCGAVWRWRWGARVVGSINMRSEADSWS